MTHLTELKMHQAWQPALDEHFRPAIVRVGWTKEAMLVEAELSDLDMFNPVTEFNQVAYPLGDVFEIFVRPENQDAYYEIHITPENQILQLRFPDAREVRKLKLGNTPDEKLAKYKIKDPRIHSSVHVDRSGHKWIVNATVPFKLVVENGPMQPGHRWFCSFCRYDYTRSPKQLVLSSTSPHVQADFHRQHEWIPITYQG